MFLLCSYPSKLFAMKYLTKIVLTPFAYSYSNYIFIFLSMAIHRFDFNNAYV